MFEAVGREYWNTFFKKVNNLLAKNGKAVIQTITIDDKLFDAYKSLALMQLEHLYFKVACFHRKKFFRNTQ